MIKGYMTADELCARYKVSKRTLYRWMDRSEKPLPAPRIRGTAGNNRWAIDDIEAYEESLAA